MPRLLPLTLLSFLLGRGDMTSNTSLKTWLERDDFELVAEIVSDVRRHVAALRSSGETFYGYAVLPGDYCTQPNPATLVVAFNRESDIAPENAHDVYYRYSVDEWMNYVHDGFEASNSKLKSLLDEFRSAHSPNPDSFQLDEYETGFVAKVNRAILNAMLELKSNRTLDEDTFAIIWFSDSDYEIVNESAKALNKHEVYEQFASEFQ
jgi:hypothetical protein